MPLNKFTSNNRPALSLKIPEPKEGKHNVLSMYAEPQHASNIKLYPQIKTISNLQTFFTYLEKNINFSQKVLVVFDVDEVLLHKRKIISIFTKDSPAITLMPGTDNSINELSKYADVICLTARSQMQEINFKEYNINLLNSCNKITLTYHQKTELSKFGYFYKDNIIYTNILEKGAALANFYSFSATQYDKVIFIDDFKNNCLSVIYALYDQYKNINIESFHLEKPEDNMHCSLNIEGYFLKEQAHFYATNDTNEKEAKININDEVDIC